MLHTLWTLVVVLAVMAGVVYALRAIVGAGGSDLPGWLLWGLLALLLVAVLPLPHLHLHLPKLHWPHVGLGPRGWKWLVCTAVVAGVAFALGRRSVKQ